ncbi:serine/threonine-protein kinase PINK1, mitochondrial-like isoform X2 [Corticium candelabrum]|uniref:serine/threonine-protein kinase PINK1, mitochondrial-like isoform X2 n=1 Tax=Corticium candelabrum TaxID=121492 RepID=UPI002E262FCB|nr:serine/threonine-protein kinase PINK1, mitochondrial-like isoform X2 [Corticium candelabrum]
MRIDEEYVVVADQEQTTCHTISEILNEKIETGNGASNQDQLHEECSAATNELLNEKGETKDEMEKKRLQQQAENLARELGREQERHRQCLIENEELRRQLSGGYCRLIQLNKNVKTAEQRRLILENREARYLSSISSLENLNIGKCIGKSVTKPMGQYGCNSIVYEVKGKEASQERLRCVLKAVFNPYATDDDVPMSEEDIDRRFRLEYDIPCIPHRNIIRVLHHFCSEIEGELPEWPPEGGHRSLFLLMEQHECNLQTHCRLLRKNGLMTPRTLLLFLVQLLAGIEHLGKHNIVHRDLKLDNVLVSREGPGDNVRLVICDFGCSYHAPNCLEKVSARNLRDTGGGNTVHLARELSYLPEDPEVTRDVSKADLWAIGMMAHEIATGTDPTNVVTHEEKRRKSHGIPTLPSLPPEYSIHCRKLLESLLHFDVDKRPNASEAGLLCCILLYGPPIPEGDTMDTDEVKHWHLEQVMTLKDRSDEDLLCDPIFLNYLHLFSPAQVASLMNQYLLH